MWKINNTNPVIRKRKFESITKVDEVDTELELRESPNPKKLASENMVPELIGRQMNTIRSGIRSLIYFSLLQAKTGKESYFWLSTIMVHLEHFVLSFNKLFGSPNHNDTHWQETISKKEFEKIFFIP